MPDGDKFFHRPISIIANEFTPLEPVRTLPVSETLVTINVKTNLKSAKALVLLLLDALLEEEPVDLVTFSISGLMK